LRENIETKGKNSYYYAHARKIDAPKWDGNEAPRLLSKTDDNSATSPKKSKPIENLKNYAWLDEDKKIKIYITLEGVGELNDDCFELSWEKKIFFVQNFRR